MHSNAIESIMQAVGESDWDHAAALIEDAREQQTSEETLGFIGQALIAARKGETEGAKELLQKALEAVEPVEERKFTSDQRKKMADKGSALPDGSFPIANAQDLKNAIQAIGRAKNPAAAKAHIKKRAAALGLTNLLPDSWKETDDETWAAGALVSVIQAVGEKLNHSCDCHDENCGYEKVEIAESDAAEWISESEAGFIEAALDGPNVYRVSMITAGISQNRNYWSPQLLQRSAKMFEGTRAFADHPTRTEMSDRPERSIKDIIGWYENARWTPTASGGKVTANLHLLEGPVANMVREAHARGKPDLIQLSVNVSGKRVPRMINGVMTREVAEIHRVHSVDAVTEASAGGSIDQLVASERPTKEVEELMALDNISSEDLFAAIEGREDLRKALAERLGIKAPEVDQPKETKTDQPAPPAAGSEELNQLLMQMRAEAEAIRQEREIDRAARELEKALAESNLPEPVLAKLRKRYTGRVFEHTELEEDVTAERETLTALTAAAQIPATVPWSDAPTGISERDRWAKAMEGLLAGKTIDGVPPFRGLRHAYHVITGRDAFDITGPDVLEAARGYDSGIANQAVGQFLETTSAATMGSDDFTRILGDSITRRALSEYRYPALQDWRRISNVVPVSDLREQKREKLGEFYLLKKEAVSGTPGWSGGESVTYANLVDLQQSLPEEEGFYQPSKAHGTAALTLEMVINDDIGKLRKIPTALGRSAAGLIYVTVFDFLRNNVDESTYLRPNVSGARLISIDATRSPGNLVTNVRSNDSSIVALNDANLQDAKVRFMTMQAQTSTGAPFNGARKHSYILADPKLLIIAPENLGVALALRDSISKVNTNTHEVNIHKGSFEIMTINYWQVSGAGNQLILNNTLSYKNMWFLCADPNDIPMIEVGFLNGREDPEIFVQDQETVGNMFTKDEITYKVRHFWGANPLDHRGFVGATTTS